VKVVMMVMMMMMMMMVVMNRREKDEMTVTGKVLLSVTDQPIGLVVIQGLCIMGTKNLEVYVRLRRTCSLDNFSLVCRCTMHSNTDCFYTMK